VNSNEVLQRTFDAELEVLDAERREVFGRCVPYGQVAEVADQTPEGVRVYRESFDLGAFRGVTKAPNRVVLTHEHETLPLGFGTELLERDDGLYGTFVITRSGLGDHVLQLVRDGVLHGLSVVARTLSAGKRRGGVIVRTSCHLESVGLTQRPAYAGAEVLAVRTQLDVERPRRNAELDARLIALGLTPPD